MKIAKALASTYVFEDLEMDEAAECKISLKARKAGLFAWLAARFFKRMSGMTFDVVSDSATYDNGWHQWIPVKKISNVDGGYYMNDLLVVLAVLALIAGVWTISSGGFGLLAIAALLFYLYSRSRRFLVAITADSGDGIVFGIKRSTVGGRALSDEDAWKMPDIIKRLVVAQTRQKKLDPMN